MNLPKTSPARQGAYPIASTATVSMLDDDYVIGQTMAIVVDSGQGPIRFILSGVFKRILVIFGALLCVGATPNADEKPMLWETTTQTVSDKLLNTDYASRWSSKVGPPKTEQLCLKPYQPKLGKVQRADVDCKYTRISNRNGRVFRKRVCKGDPPSNFVTIMKGKESADAYDLMLVTTVRNDRGKKLWVSEFRETGQRIGECPQGMPLAN